MLTKINAFESDLIIEHRGFGASTVEVDLTYNHAGKNLSLVCRTTTYDPQGQEKFKKYFYTKLHDYAADIMLYYPKQNLPFTLIDTIFGELFQNIFESTLYTFIQKDPEANRLTQNCTTFMEKAEKIKTLFPNKTFPVTFYFEAELNPHTETATQTSYTLDLRMHNHITLSQEALTQIQRKLRLETKDIIMESAEEGNIEKGSGGIGIALVRDIVHEYGGYIIVDHIPLPGASEEYGSFSVFISFPVGPRKE